MILIQDDVLDIILKMSQAHLLNKNKDTFHQLNLLMPHVHFRNQQEHIDYIPKFATIRHTMVESLVVDSVLGSKLHH